MESVPQSFEIHVELEHAICISIETGDPPRPIYSTASKSSVIDPNSHIIVFRGNSRESLVATIDFNKAPNITVITYAATQAKVPIAAPVNGVPTSFVVADSGAKRAFSWQNYQDDHPSRHAVVDEKGEVWADIVLNTQGKRSKFGELKIVKSGVQDEMLDQIVVSGIALLWMEAKRQKKDIDSTKVEETVAKGL
ncbi:MAG: hypothetical protein Q9217_006981 [Psora testacea]